VKNQDHLLFHTIGTKLFKQAPWKMSAAFVILADECIEQVP